MRASTFHLLVSLLAVAAATAAGAQSFNVDVDLFNSSPQVGGGAPSSAFGAAANQIGYWNAFPTDNQDEPFSLRDLSGGSTSVVASAHGTGGGGGWNNPVNTGDYALLLNDVDEVSGTLAYTVSGLAPGRYQVYTYVVTPVPGHSESAFVSVAGSAPQSVSGSMPGNRFVLGRTHSLHEIDFSGGSLSISIASASAHNYVNGFQIVAVPEPTSAAAFAVGSAVVLSYLRKNQA